MNHEIDINRDYCPMVKVSVVMAVYNAETFLRESIDSILNQTYCDFELIIVDDASTDSSKNIISSFVDKRIKIIRHIANKGAAASRNDAIRISRGEYIAVMDADDISLPHRIEEEVKYLDKHKEIALVGSGIYDNIDENGFILGTSYLPIENDVIQNTLLEKWCFLHPSIMFRREIISKVGYYREEFETAEDHDFILRVLDCYKVSNINNKLMLYRINPNGLSIHGKNYISEYGLIAIRVAKARRQMRDENLNNELAKIKELKQRRNKSGYIFQVLGKWKDSYYASERYYGFGCRHLYMENIKEARKCFIRSMKTSILFIKSFLCFIATYFPLILIRNIKGIFKASRQYADEIEKYISN